MLIIIIKGLATKNHTKLSASDTKPIVVWPALPSSHWTTSHQIFEKYFSHFAPKYFLVWISKYCAREMIFNQSKVCVFCKSEEAEFKESWTRNGDHYCTLFFPPLRFLRTRHYPKYFPTKTIRQNCPNFNFQ